MAALSSQQLEDLQSFLKDWLRHTGRSQSDLRRALHASSIRMPVLLEALHHTFIRQGLAGLAEQLCAVDARWREEGQQCPADGGAGMAAGAADLGQLDLLLQEIRAEART
jgi:hypothetical protein